MALVFTNIRTWSCPDFMHGQAGSTREMSKLELELGFKLNTKVAEFFKA